MADFDPKDVISEFQPIDLAQESLLEQPESSTGEALARGALHGATFGFGERAEAGIKSALSDENYEDLLKSIRERNKKVEAEHPVASTLGKIGGGVGGIMLGGALGGALKGAGLLTRAGTAAEAAGTAAEAAQAGKALATAGEAAGVGATALKTAEAATPAAELISAGGAAEKAKGAGTAIETLFPRFSKFIPGGTGNAVTGGAAFGALSGAGESEDFTDVEQTAKNIGKAAVEGALTGGIAQGVMGGIGKVAGRLKSIPVIQEFGESFKAARAGKDLAGMEAETRKALTDTIENKLLNKLSNLQDYISKQYDNIYDALGSDVRISGNKLSSIIDIADEAVVTPRQLDGIIKKLQREAEGIYNPKFKTGDYKQYKELTDKIKNLKDVMTESLPDEAKKALEFANKQNYMLSKTRAELGIPAGFDTSAGTQKLQEGYIDTLENLTKTFINAAKGEAKDINTVNSALNTMETLEKNTINRVVGPEKNAIREFLGAEKVEPEIGNIIKEVTEKAKDYNLSELLNKKSILGSAKKLELSPSAVTANIGQLGGATVRTAEELGKAPLYLARDIADLVTSRSETAANIAKKMVESADSPTTQKAGQMLNKILMEPDISARRALMFSLSQQPWFREAVGKSVGLEPKE